MTNAKIINGIIEINNDDIYRKALRNIYMENNISLPHYKVAREIINSFINFLNKNGQIVDLQNINELAHYFLYNIYGLSLSEVELAA